MERPNPDRKIHHDREGDGSIDPVPIEESTPDSFQSYQSARDATLVSLVAGFMMVLVSCAGAPVWTLAGALLCIAAAWAFYLRSNKIRPR